MTYFGALENLLPVAVRGGLPVISTECAERIPTAGAGGHEVTPFQDMLDRSYGPGRRGQTMSKR